jgi:hypothetical protein
MCTPLQNFDRINVSVRRLHWKCKKCFLFIVFFGLHWRWSPESGIRPQFKAWHDLSGPFKALEGFSPLVHVTWQLRTWTTCSDGRGALWKKVCLIFKRSITWATGLLQFVFEYFAWCDRHCLTCLVEVLDGCLRFFGVSFLCVVLVIYVPLSAFVFLFKIRIRIPHQ